MNSDTRINEFGLEKVEAIAKGLNFFMSCPNGKDFFSSKYAVVSCGNLSYDAGPVVVSALARLDFCGFNVKSYVRVTADLGDDIHPVQTLVSASANSASDKLYSVPEFMTQKAYGDAEAELIVKTNLKQVLLVPEFDRANEFTSLGRDVETLLYVRELLVEFFAAIGAAVEVKMLNIPDARDQSGLNRFFGMYMTNASRSREKLGLTEVAGVNFADEGFAAALRGDLQDYSLIRKAREASKISKRSLEELMSNESAIELIRNVFTRTVEGYMFARRFSAPRVTAFNKNSPQLYDNQQSCNRFMLADAELIEKLSSLFHETYTANFSGTKLTWVGFLNKIVDVIMEDRLSEIRGENFTKLHSMNTFEANDKACDFTVDLF